MLISSHLLSDSLARLMLGSLATLLLPVHWLAPQLLHLRALLLSLTVLHLTALIAALARPSESRVQAGHSCSPSNAPPCCSPGLASLAKHSFPIKGRETF